MWGRVTLTRCWQGYKPGAAITEVSVEIPQKLKTKLHAWPCLQLNQNHDICQKMTELYIFTLSQIQKDKHFLFSQIHEDRKGPSSGRKKQ